jgi:serine/threonine protein kinase
MAADVYAFGCLAFELLTAELLFDADDEMSLISLHLEHAGVPPRLAEFAEKPGCSGIAELIAGCLKPDPRQRPSAPAVRKALAELAPTFGANAWPLAGRVIEEAELSA